MWFLQANNLIEHHSTESALIKVTNYLLVASDKGVLSILVLLSLSAASGTIDHQILIKRGESFKVDYAVPQRSVLGSIFFILCMLPLGNFIRKHDINFHCYANEKQLYLSFKPNETAPKLLYSDKTKIIFFVPTHLRNMLLNAIVTLGDITLTFNRTV